MSNCWVGFDIGGTKCAVSAGEERAGAPRVLDRREIATPSGQAQAMRRMCDMALELAGERRILGVGISAGGPMDQPRGILLNPPNLPGWSGVSWTDFVSRALGAPARMENDANACALAEWRWGAGRGCQSMAFLTFGTGLGAGLILDGRLYRGATGAAGELGHWRLSDYGPSGYGKQGSFEGFCSGGGIRQLAATLVTRERQKGAPVGFETDAPSARAVARAAAAGDALALEILRRSARQLGRGLALLIDLVNPERIVIGSIYTRCEALLRDGMMETLREEALPSSLAACRVMPAALGDGIGDYAALAIASQAGAS